MNNNLKSIVGDEVIEFIKELLDPNAGSIYQPQGLDPTHVRLFEKIKEELNKKNKENEETVGKD